MMLGSLMNRTTRLGKFAAALGVALVLGLIAPVAAQATPSGSQGYYVSSTIPTSLPGGSPMLVAVNAATNTVYAMNGHAQMSVIDGATGQVTATINASSASPGLWNVSRGIAVNATTNTVYVAYTANAGVKGLAVLDGATGQYASTIPTPFVPDGVAVNEATNTVYVTNASNNSVTVIDGATEQVTSTVAVGSYPDDLAVNEATNTVYVNNTRGHAVSVIDGVTGLVTSTIDVGGVSSEGGLVVDPTTNTIYVPVNYSSMDVIDGATGLVTSTIPVPGEIQGLAIDPAIHTVFASAYNGNSVSVINEMTGQVAVVPVDNTPGGIAVNPVTSTAYFANWDPNFNSVSVLSPPAPSVPSLTTDTLPNAAAGIAYSGTVASTGFPYPTFAVSSGSLPGGMVLNANSGVISGTPANTGNASFTVTATNASGSDSKSYTIAVDAVLTQAPVPTITGLAVTGQTLTAVPGSWAPAAVDLSYQWSQNGAVIPGATSATHLIGQGDWGSVFTVSVTGSKSGYRTESKTSAATGAVTGPVTEVAGVDRFGTSAAISASAFAPGVPVAYITDGYAFPDALSAAPVAGRDGAPILMVLPDEIPATIQAELTRLKPQRIVILGGFDAVSDSVELALQQFTSGTVSRTAGVDRFATSAAISAAAFSPGVPVVYVTDGENFPDALSAAPVAGKDGAPMLLVLPNAVPATIKTELTRLKPQSIVVLGGTSVVSDSVKAALRQFTTGAVSRTSGADRFATSAAISAAAFAPGAPIVYVTNGYNFPDALSAAAVAGKVGAPVLLLPASGSISSVVKELQRLKPKQIVILGGPESLGDTGWLYSFIAI
jgi:YVTN family beta-propeller protein